MYLEESESEPQNVALRKESVDRNSRVRDCGQYGRYRRSPQGERG